MRPSSEPQSLEGPDASRRGALLGMATVLAGASLSAAAPQLASAATPVVAVGTYLPAADGLPGFCLYSPDSKKTPAIRAGVIKPEPAYYQFAVPESWSEAPLLNPLTGNFCMPRCEEPWYEFKFEDGKEGTAQLVVTELQKLGAKRSATTADLGAPEQLIPRIGNFITGSFVPDEEDIVSAVPKKGADGLTYYVYEEGLAYLFIVTANDKQWGAAESKLRTMLESFQA
ncbi:hypothetical protein CHLNCDRAFT_134225 [Chlorella variabilis]|uniref:PsbP C-terminal domain-containing protein n=1 Tax=Chlorella variabilis TaxID=554065 RepID=E1ZFJ5_CHLVA|nr:hypothetical protein CHLNCDRAFT_134225 [Chlorella variabilis]EFN55290.1 hypothetical protein CHLNCDRAFT_134225 [Chlorella variabilis]|eukprot:XP_005847392.1 hypothetical protein CHLNCDRAFT_134225 [Chlorella variabilis]